MKISTLLLVCFSTCTLAAADQKETAPARLDLGKAEAIALRYAPRISEAYFKAEASREVVRQVRSSLFPQIEAIASAVGAGPDIANAFGAHDNTAQVTRLGATGGLNSPSVYSRESNGLMFSQLITDFGKTPDLISAARYQSLSEAERARLARAQVLLLVDQSYFKALGAQALLRVANETLSARQLTYDQVSALTRSKLKSELDLSFAKADLANAKLLVLQAKNSVEQSFAELSAALGYREQHDFELADEPQYSFPDVDIHLLIEQALQYRPEVVALRAESEGAVKYTAAMRAEHYPVVSAIGAIGRTPIGNENVYGNYSAAGINVELPIFTGGLLDARYHEADDRARAAKKAVEDAEDEIVRTVREAWLNAGSALQKISVTDEILASSKDAWQLAESRYKLGLISIIELSQAQLIETQAEIGAASAIFEYQIDSARLQYEIGALKYRTPATAVAEVKR